MRLELLVTCERRPDTGTRRGAPSGGYDDRKVRTVRCCFKQGSGPPFATGYYQLARHIPGDVQSLRDRASLRYEPRQLFRSRQEPSLWQLLNVYADRQFHSLMLALEYIDSFRVSMRLCNTSRWPCRRQTGR
jgi:hypothetical protein